MRGIPDPGRASRAVELVVQGAAAAPRVRTVCQLTGDRYRPPSGQRPNPGAIFVTQCSRCGRDIDAHGIGMECFGCIEAARAVWPWATAILGEMSGE